MTTATRPKNKPSAAERERDLEDALAEAKAEHDDVRQRAHQHRTRIEELRAQLWGRAVSARGEFSETGVPRPKSPAGKIAAEIDKLAREDNFDALIAGAQGRIEHAEQALVDHRNQRGRELLAEMVPEARRVVEDWRAWAAEGRARYQAIVRVATRAHRLMVTTRLYGRQGQGSVPDYEHAQHVLKLAEEPPPLPLPRPFVDEMEAEEEAENE
jgi:hypothetical protein